MIRIEHLRKEYKTSVPLKDINTTINKGDVICIIGPSGTGKSTLLRMINLLERPTSGKIFFYDEEITAKNYKPEKARNRMTMVFQSFNLFNHLSVIENLVIPQVDILGINKQEAYDNSMKLLEKVGMKNQYLKYPSVLSGGQKQRVAIARALVMKPEIILFDEPTSALDPIKVSEIQNIIKDLAKDNQTMIIVTHDMKFAEEVANRIFYMDQGVIYEDGSPKQIFHQQKRARTKAFIENLTVLKISIHSNFDYNTTFKTVEEFENNFKLPTNISNELRTIINEFLIKTLIKEYSINEIRLIVSYDEKKQKLFFNCKYNGDKTKVLKNIKNKEIKNIIKSIKYENITEKNYINWLQFETK